VIRFLLLIGVIFVEVAGAASRPDSSLPRDEGQWVAAWVSAQQRTETNNLPPPPGLQAATLRQIIQPALRGRRLRVVFSNEFGDAPLAIAAAHVAKASSGSAIDLATDQRLTFDHQSGTTIPAGASIISDEIPFPVEPFENLSITMLFGSVPPQVTGHPGSRTTSYLQSGDAVAAHHLPNALPIDHWYVLSRLEVFAAPSASAVVVLGDSITDGRGSTTNQNDRWPNLLGRRLRAHPATAHVSVLNQGIGANRLLRDGVGPSVLARFDRDVLAPAGVNALIILEGINDLGTAVTARAHGESGASARDLIFGYQQIILRAHSHGISVYGATILPFDGFASYFNAESEAARQEVNQWIRTSGEFDGVIDFDATTRDASMPSKLSAKIDGGDHLHPSAGGYRIMADSIDLTLFSSGRASAKTTMH
jgi:lysophospholipase L1-like esterase